ncbi:hypothetical protein HZH66_007450 [Vespula vulgaris]|uniref:Uncharacterized protein n=1 Tax=Vespula vulgaris TaxID=7454 RepID=A0A834N6X2_VESVU|nr:hypothetical protein HZH66_007450 [Vespula vulgaris]
MGRLYGAREEGEGEGEREGEGEEEGGAQIRVGAEVGVGVRLAGESVIRVLRKVWYLWRNMVRPGLWHAAKSNLSRWMMAIPNGYQVTNLILSILLNVLIHTGEYHSLVNLSFRCVSFRFASLRFVSFRSCPFSLQLITFPFLSPFILPASTVEY